MSDDDMTEYDSLSPEPESSGSPSPPAKMGGFGAGSGRKVLFNNPNDFDIYCDRTKGINYIFHQCELNYTIDHLEFDPETSRITVFSNDGQQVDLGAKIQWLVRPYIAKEQYLFIIRTQNGKTVDGVQVFLKIKDPEITKENAGKSEKTLN